MSSKSSCPDLKNNGRKKLLLFGVTGSGKSALCNALCQPVKKDDVPLKQYFPESTNQQIGNTNTIMKNVNFLRLRRREISLVDTVGFNSTEMDNTAIAELIVSLKESCDYIHLFAIVVSSPKRIEASLKETIELFVGMFGKEKFWENALLIFTNLQQSDDQIHRRSKTYSDEELTEDFSRTIKETFFVENDVPTLVMDSHYDGSKLDERTRFKFSACKLYNMLMKSEGTSVKHVQRVVDKYDGLREEVIRLSLQGQADRLAIEAANRRATYERQAKERAMRQADYERQAKERAMRQADYERSAFYLYFFLRYAHGRRRR